MGVAILYPQDCLQNPLSNRQTLISPPRSRKQPRNTNRAKPNGRRRSLTNHLLHATTCKKFRSRNFMGEVKILKRGEQLSKGGSVTFHLTSTSQRGDLQDKTSRSVKKTESLDLVYLNHLRAGGPIGSKDQWVLRRFCVHNIVAPKLSTSASFFMKNNDVKKNEDATTDLRRILVAKLEVGSCRRDSIEVDVMSFSDDYSNRMPDPAGLL
ncbi:hypothetical protein K2173_014708 [Erythroxylum novogranatense]|uniref:Uncharacterized protein n=1 Tax=Erythroxylum novogranatense TaxID=1862640 RepID=A0AAV8TGP3_9ROSI|nr:hypothetical protein K2173_014708 [Erythroxylum novogranatense]